jgi:hypothetical protein
MRWRIAGNLHAKRLRYCFYGHAQSSHVYLCFRQGILPVFAQPGIVPGVVALLFLRVQAERLNVRPVWVDLLQELALSCLPVEGDVLR